ncbi:glycosyltransferase family 2 protein [Clostridium beijerinckii]|uniref:glycosyltransferase family 2 protein n=1 Tax=Clostridium beijerinckii TaxID=1520 RepID=UPI00047B2DE5|nr:glycosyltransferase family A protein [Clostridium beijerinckii]
MNREPLVSILIPNYNYAHYLEQCLNSVLNQTYNNIEVIFCDNNSEDNSYQIAIQYQKLFKENGKYFELMKNKRNIGSSRNSSRCYYESEGDFVIFLSSDDFMESTFIEKCVNIMKKNQYVGMVMAHRNEINEKGEIFSTMPFYNKSCIIPGEEQSAVFMMAGIAVPSQILIRRSIYEKSRKEAALAFQIAGDWFNNFLVSIYSDVAYIAEPLCNYRVHSGNETSGSELNLLGIFEHYQLINQFVSIAKAHKMIKPIARYDEAVIKLGSMCLRYTMKMFRDNQIESARRYLCLAPVFDKEIVKNELYNEFINCLELNEYELLEKLDEIDKKNSVKRTISYSPPEGAIEI